MKHMALFVVIVAGCSKKAAEEPPPAKSATSQLAAAVNAVKAVAAALPDKPAVAPEPAGPPATGWTIARVSPRPWIDEAGRGGMKCEFASWDGTGPKRTAMFKISIPGHGASHKIQTKVTYYDQEGHYVEEFPHFVDGPIQPLTPLGLTGTGLKDNMVTADCEIDSVVNEDHTFWFNHNLSLMGRPKGGFPEAALKEHAGEHLTVEVLDTKKGRFKLKNLTDKPIKSARLWLLYVDKDGKPATGLVDVEAKIAAGATIEHTVEIKGDGLAEIQAADPKEVEAWATSVETDDGLWRNENLNLYSFPVH